MKFIQLAKTLKEEGLAPVYLVEGDDAYFRDHALDQIRAECNLAQPTLNETQVSGVGLKGEKFSAFLSSLYSLPFLDEKRLVRLSEYYPAEKEFAALEGYLKAPCATTVLVIFNSGKKANGTDLKKKKGITFVDCSRADEETLTRWLFALMRREGLNVESDAAALMARYCAMDAARLRLEVTKLKLLLGAGATVTRREVDEYIAKDTEYKVYELTQAASQKNAAAFFEILNDLNAKGFDENAALSALTSHFKTLSEIAVMRGSDAEIGKALSLHPYAVKKNRELVMRLKKERIEELYGALFTLSTGAKSGLYTKTGALSTAIAKIFFG